MAWRGVAAPSPPPPPHPGAPTPVPPAPRAPSPVPPALDWMLGKVDSNADNVSFRASGVSAVLLETTTVSADLTAFSYGRNPCWYIGTQGNQSRQRQTYGACFAAINIPSGKPFQMIMNKSKETLGGSEVPLKGAADKGKGAADKGKDRGSRYQGENSDESSVYSDELEEGDEGDLDTDELLVPTGFVDKENVSLFCSGCHNSLSQRDLDAMECDGCHRWFHLYGDCVTKSLQKFASKSEIELGSGSDGSGNGSGGGQTWRLISCRPPVTATRSMALANVYSVLSKTWAYRMGDFTKFDYAAVLRDSEDRPVCAALLDVYGAGGRWQVACFGSEDRPMCAALLDVYGADVAEIFVMATHPKYRGMGHARALMKEALEPTLSSSGVKLALMREALEPTLTSSGVKLLAVSVDEGDDDSLGFWKRFGFTSLKPSEQKTLGYDLPQFMEKNTSGVSYLSKKL
eukprot:gene1915-33328_t